MLLFPFLTYHVPKLGGGLCVLARRFLLLTSLRAEHGRESNSTRGMDHVCVPFDASLIMPRYISSGTHQHASSILKLYLASVTRSVIVHPWAEISFVSPPPLLPAPPQVCTHLEPRKLRAHVLLPGSLACCVLSRLPTATSRARQPHDSRVSRS